MQAEENPVLEREINLHLQVIRYKEFTLHNQRRRLVNEIKYIDEQIKDLYDELRKYENVSERHKLARALREHFDKYNK